MPNTKEKGKLIDVLSKHIPYGHATLCLIAEELMAEGVTFATDNNVGDKWISVKDRLPEDLEENKGKKVINCIVEHDPYGNGKTTAQFRQRKYDKYSDKWYWSKIGGCTVIRWTMMPQPPKG
jgi:hypothetical protein